MIDRRSGVVGEARSPRPDAAWAAPGRAVGLAGMGSATGSPRVASTSSRVASRRAASFSGSIASARRASRYAPRSSVRSSATRASPTTAIELCGSDVATCWYSSSAPRRVRTTGPAPPRAGADHGPGPGGHRPGDRKESVARVERRIADDPVEQSAAASGRRRPGWGRNRHQVGAVNRECPQVQRRARGRAGPGRVPVSSVRPPASGAAGPGVVRLAQRNRASSASRPTFTMNRRTQCPTRSGRSRTCGCG